MMTKKDTRALGFFLAAYVLVVCAVAIATVLRYAHG
jgi:hypothetical protein